MQQLHTKHSTNNSAIAYAATLAAALALAAFGASPALAATQRTPVTTATSSCTIAPQPIEFGNYNVFDPSPKIVTVQWPYTCMGTNPSQATGRVALTWGDSGGPGHRALTDGQGHRLFYQVCLDPACTIPLGDGSDLALTAPIGASAGGQSSFNGSSGTLMLYAVLPPRQNLPVGSYNDELTAGTLPAVAEKSVIVHVDVDPDCTDLSTTASIAFGNYNVFAASAIDAPDAIEYECTTGTLPTLTVNGGLNSSSCGGTRCMTDGNGDYLDYSLFQDPGYSVPWVPGTAYSVSASTYSALINGQLPSGQSVPVGSYSDTVTITIAW